MLNEIITLDFTEEDGVTATSSEYKKRSNDGGILLYKESSVILDDSLPRREFVLKAIEPKPVANHYGTYRNMLTMRRDFLLPTPQGESILPALFKVEASAPKGLTPAQKTQFIKEFISLMGHADFWDFYLYHTAY